VQLDFIDPSFAYVCGYFGNEIEPNDAEKHVIVILPDLTPLGNERLNYSTKWPCRARLSLKAFSPSRQVDWKPITKGGLEDFLILEF